MPDIWQKDVRTGVISIHPCCLVFEMNDAELPVILVATTKIGLGNLLGIKNYSLSFSCMLNFFSSMRSHPLSSSIMRYCFLDSGNKETII